MNKELMEALNVLEKEKGISKDTLFDAIENSLMTACKNHFDNRVENITVEINRDTCDFHCYAKKLVVEEVADSLTEITLEDAKSVSKKAKLGDEINVEIKSKEFGRIATQNAKNESHRKSEKKKEALFTTSTMRKKKT